MYPNTLTLTPLPQYSHLNTLAPTLGHSEPSALHPYPCHHFNFLPLSKSFTPFSQYSYYVLVLARINQNDAKNKGQGSRQMEIMLK
jgi:hypothetical protein